MLNKILSWVPYTPPVSTPRWDKFVSLIRLNANRYRIRYANDQYMANECTRFFETLLINIPVDKFFTKGMDDYDRFANIDYSLVRLLSSSFDPIVNLKNSCNTLTKSNVQIIPEYYLNVTSGKPFSCLPMNRPWANWAKLKSVRILEHDSRELCSNLLPMQITFKKHQPNFLLASVDIPAMVMQYIKFVEHQREFGLSPDYRMFIKHHIVEPWHDDLIKVWLFNLFQDIVYGNFKIFKLFNEHGIINRGKVKAAKSNVVAQLTMLKTNRITTAKFLSAKWLGNMSILHWLNVMDNVLIVPDFRQYDYLKFLTELPYIKLVLHLCMMENTQSSLRIAREIWYQFNLYVKTNIGNKVINSNHRAYVMSEVKNLTEATKSLRPR